MGTGRFRAQDESIGFYWNTIPFAKDPGLEIFLNDGPVLWVRMRSADGWGHDFDSDALMRCVQIPNVPLQPLSWGNMHYLRAVDGVGTYGTEDPANRSTTSSSICFAFSKGEIWAADTSLLSYSEAAMNMLQSILFPLTENQAQRIFQGLDAPKVGALLAARPRDFIEFEYKDGNSYIPFAQASQGQQAAALLDLLLRQEAGTLIIDQPEDDLDNKIIMYVVNLLHGSKLGRQLIFATHNANFVVNGDADKVVALIPGSSSTPANGSAARIEIEADGAIETPTVREVITDTVEGGKEAFDLRGRKYQFI